MADALTVPRHEAGTVRVFAVNTESHEEARAIATDPERLRSALGAATVDPAGVELVDMDDLGGMALTAYLAEGYGIEAAAMAEDRARLDTLGGDVLLVRASAFHGQEQALEPGPDLRLIGRYAEPKPVPSFEGLPRPGARGAGGRAPQAAPPPAARGGRLIWIVAAIALIALVLLVSGLL